MTLTTPRYVLHYPQSTDPDNVPSDMLSLATDLDNKMVGYSQGTLASRPAAGVTGRSYRATDTGFTYMDIGTAWIISARPIADGAGVLAYNAAWPATPFDGQETDRYSDAGGTEIWRFRFNNAGPAGKKWTFIGGSPLTINQLAYGSVPATINGIGGVTWISSGSTFTPGVSGDFDIAFLMYGANTGGSQHLYGQLFASVAGTINLSVPPIGAHVKSIMQLAGPSYTTCDIQRTLTLVAGTAYSAYWNVDPAGAANGNAFSVGLRCTPNRVG